MVLGKQLTTLEEPSTTEGEGQNLLRESFTLPRFKEILAVKRCHLGAVETAGKRRQILPAGHHWRV